MVANRVIREFSDALKVRLIVPDVECPRHWTRRGCNTPMSISQMM